jgi:mono/diheme cytochrome c family protein
MRFIAFLVALVVVAAAAAVGYAVVTGLDARAQPGALETRIARSVRRLAIPRLIRDRPNPVAASADVLAEGLAHYADHCAVCHANDGSGNTEMGRGLFPKPPDMRLAATQQLTDGELFYIIEHGVRFTGMPGWSSGTPDGVTSTWHLVHFIRHLSQMTEDETQRMETLTPRSAEQIRQQIEEEQFLRGAEPAPRESSGHEHAGGHR